MNWQTWIVQGDQYLKSATPKEGKKSVFGPDIRYNLLSMSLEAYIMAILDVHRNLPENHTYTDLMSALETVIEIDENLKNRILKYENIQSICSIDKYSITTPTNEELDDLHGAIVEISRIAHEVVSENRNLN
ncbi:MAG: hypothetical protein SNJ71_01760 [Bacteroidales bacterium]